ncbi:cytochrome c peroxidase [Niveibacterium umoris]|uniref:Cytochrome c peroxidase n=1 Tax=Niveibacterium umoris TaxID=1193620 RepID=A0A840BCD0_9RHOO|nr:cytochrome c peroxidase [Niveibacterium umoris]MBB4010725.1 cytochrome c peroxidase [Niveibacterium umoris]
MSERYLQNSAALIFSTFILVACGGGSESSGTATPGLPNETLSSVAALGEQIFNDASLSASGKMSCATCHQPAAAHAAPASGTNGIGTPDGGPALDVQGFRKAPSLRYLKFAPAFNFDAEGTPNGGFMRDGRFQSLAEQAGKPFFEPHEMALANAAELASKAGAANWAAAFKAQFGADVFGDPAKALDRIAYALAQYQKEDPAFAPFDSKYDAFLAGKTTLTPTELRGLALFNDPQKGNCAACHPSARSANVPGPLFTDFSYDVLGVPRNDKIRANRDTNYFDLGLCGPFRKDMTGRTDLCGAFKVPTLRNVAVGGPYFHNGRFATLKEAMRFYVRRDTNPEEWYPRLPDGSIDKFDDLPAAWRKNVNATEVPYNRKAGDAPALNDSEIDDLIAFLTTLNDGWTPQH